MRRHVVQTFATMDVALAVFSRDLFEKIFEIRLDIGVGILLNEKRRGGMAAENREQADGDLLSGHPVGHLRRDLVETFAMGRNMHAMERLAHWIEGNWRGFRP